MVRIVTLLLLLPSLAWAADCTVTSIDATPLIDLGRSTYLGRYEGGLYPNGRNTMPSRHLVLGSLAATLVEPLSRRGEPAANGRIVLMSIGMSNCQDHFSGFIEAFDADPGVNRAAVRLINAATPGQTAEHWDDPTRGLYNIIRDQHLADAGLTEAQVQVVWLLQANGFPEVSLPDPNADAFLLLERMGGIARALRVRYPNLQIVFISSRIYAGYATTELNPEPYAYEYGFSVKWLIEAQIRQMAVGTIDPIAGDLSVPDAAPWLAWGPYTWADGLAPRSDGLLWECQDLRDDGTHPSQQGIAKVGAMLLDFFWNSSFTANWFRADGCPDDVDINGDGDTTPADAFAVFEAYLGTLELGPCETIQADLDDEPGLTPHDARLLFELFLDPE